MKLLAVSHACVIDVNQQLLVELERHPDVELTLIAPKRWRSDIRGDVEFRALEALRADIRTLPVLLSGNVNAHAYRGLGSALRGERFDVAYVDEEPYSLAAFQLLRLKPRLGARLLVHMKQNTYRRYPFPFCWMEHQVLRRSECVAAATADGREVLRRKGRRGRVPLIPYAVNPALFRRHDCAALKAEWGLEQFVIGYVGRLTPEKGVPDLMGALERLWADATLDFQALFVGSGPLEGEVRAFAHRCGPGKVIVRSAVPHDGVPQTMSCIDLLVLPSRTTPRWREQFGRVMVEALCCGVPVVGSDSGEIPVLLRRTGGGLIFREGDVENLAHTLRRARQDQDRLRAETTQARARIEAAYSYRVVGEKLYTICRELARAPLG
jgi:glycosyltransferase involved in cell wall biosynthesis